LLLRGHCGKAQKRILEFDILGVNSQFIEQVATLFQFFVVGICFGNQRNGFRVARLRFGIFPKVVVEASEC
jgi:hypothetical protein